MRWWLQLQNQHGKFLPLMYCFWSLIPLLCYLSCRITTGHSVKLSNISLKLPQLFRKEKMFSFFTLITSVVLGVQRSECRGYSCWFFCHGQCPIWIYIISEYKKVHRTTYWSCLGTTECALPLQKQPWLKWLLKIWLMSKSSYHLEKVFSVSGKASLVGLLWKNLRHIVESNKKVKTIFSGMGKLWEVWDLSMHQYHWV